MTGELDDRPDPVEDRLAEAMNAGVLAVDRSGRVTAWDPRARRLLGYPREEVLGRPLRLLLYRDDGPDPSSVERRLLRPLRTDAPEHGDGEAFAHRDGRPVPCSWSSTPIRTAASADEGAADEGAAGEREPGAVTGVVIVLQDAAERRAIERERRDRRDEARRARSRLLLVAEITTVLSSTLEEREVLRRLVRLVVPVLGDWAEVDLLLPDGRVERVAATHRSLGAARIRGLEGPLPPMPQTPRGPLARVLRDGVTLIVGGDDLGSGGGSDEPLGAAQNAFFRVVEARSAIITPLAARGETYGALTIGYSRPGFEYTSSDRLVVEDVARRAGLVLANARLFAAQRSTVEAMQRNLLTSLPQPGRLRLQARYLPAARASWVGGDWYDAFALPDGATGLVIGDIAGHDLQAASWMAQVRNMLRAVAWDVPAPEPQPPSTVLRRLDGVMDAVSDAETATAVFGRVEGAPDGPWRLRWCNAGHPPPLLIDRDGAARFLEEHGTLLGTPALAGTRPDGVAPLPPLSTLVLYTDGLVEARDTDIGTRLTSLRLHGSHLAPLALPDLCDELLDRMRPSGEDDVALLALRIPA
ncbi:MAG TPA: SpoIIE family protein phosphatase [Spirillospora sp.]